MPENELKLLDIQSDRRVNCWSIMLATTVGLYLDLVKNAYEERGGIRHQRDALKTTTARRIRARLVDDLEKGAIIPPVVLGLVSSDFKPQIHGEDAEKLLALIQSDSSSVSIIDGMQRTTALMEANERGDIAGNPLRVEVWVAEGADSLIYRMLVLNTGQIPWNLKQQLNVVYETLIRAIEEKVNFSRILKRKDGKVERRWNGGEFAAEDLVEAYIAFGLRRTEVDTQEHLADEFSRLDMAEALTSKKYDHFFYDILQLMVDLDIAFSRLNPERAEDGTGGAVSAEEQVNRRKRTYSRGRHVFDTQPPRVAFVVAAATAIIGRIGMDREYEESLKRLEDFKASCGALVSRIGNMNENEMEKFISLDVLSEVMMRRPSSAVGRWERNFYEQAFKVLFEVNFEVPTMETCWRA